METTDRIYLREAEQREFTALVIDIDDDGAVGLDPNVLYTRPVVASPTTRGSSHGMAANAPSPM